MVRESLPFQPCSLSSRVPHCPRESTRFLEKIWRRWCFVAEQSPFPTGCHSFRSASWRLARSRLGDAKLLKHFRDSAPRRRDRQRRTGPAHLRPLPSCGCRSWDCHAPEPCHDAEDCIPIRLAFRRIVQRRNIRRCRAIEIRRGGQAHRAPRRRRQPRRVRTTSPPPSDGPPAGPSDYALTWGAS
jgi:hypothetical protein